MRKLVALALLLTLTALFLAQSGRAQNELVLGALEVNLWPEYDRPDMLVIYKVTLPSNVVPATMTFRTPRAADRPYKITIIAEDGNRYEITDYTYEQGDEWGEVTFQVDSPNFQLDYYDPRLIKKGPGRRFEYTWPGDYAVISASILVQQPVDAGPLEFTHESVSSFTGEDNLLYYAHQIGPLEKDQTYSFSMSYLKPTNMLTWEKYRVRPADALPQSMWNLGLPWALGVLALVLIAGGVFIFWRSGLPQGWKKNRTGEIATPQGSEETPADESGVYCHRCGRRAALSDLFCRSCGTKLRI